MPPLALIAALNQDRAIGKGGGLPWHLPEDLAHFKRTTLGHAIIMGRRTYEEVGRPLPKRRNLVVTSRPIEGVECFTSVEAAVAAAHETDPLPFVIGGGGIYKAALPLVTELFLTWVDLAVPDADAFFPPFDATPFEIVERRRGDDPRLVFEHSIRRDATDRSRSEAEGTKKQE